MVAPTRHVNALFYFALGRSLGPVFSSGHAAVASDTTKLNRREDASKDRSADVAAWSDTTSIVRREVASKDVDLPKHPCFDHGLLEGPPGQVIRRRRTTKVPDPHKAATWSDETDANAPATANEDPCERLQGSLQPNVPPDHVTDIHEDGNVTEVPDIASAPDTNP